MIGDRPENAGDIPGAWPGDLPTDMWPDGPADPDRCYAHRDAEDSGEDFTGPEADDGPIDTDESFAAWRRLFPGDVPLLPSVEAQEGSGRF
mgnify:FL=1